jgi:hypothetical protein
MVSFPWNVLLPVLSSAPWLQRRLTLETVAWRAPYGDSGILAFFLDVIAADTMRAALLRHTLRVIGNSCADTDANRARVVEGNNLPSIIRRVQDEAFVPFTVPVLYNILVDYGEHPQFR